ncbi:MAG: hypothetical protein KAR21_04175, partial [Spirochaetales bacterium]|nr:hypothetical protein [Spirochaetales bacterium]
TDEKYELKRRKGSWTVYKRNNFVLLSFLEEKREEPESGFCSVYKREGRPKTFFLGKISSTTVIDKAAGVLSRKVLEQRPLFSGPPKSLTTESGLTYGLRVGLIFVIIVGVFVAFEYILLPKFGNEIGKGLGISFSTEVTIENYQSILGAFLNRIISPEHMKLLNSFYTLAAFIVLPILAGGIIYEFLGKWADKRRTKNFSQEAFSFLFGKEATAHLLAEYKLVEEEKGKTALFERLTGLGMDTSKDNFEQIYNEVKGHISGG